MRKLTDPIPGQHVRRDALASDPGVLNGVVGLLESTPSISARNASGSNAGGMVRWPLPAYADKYRYLEKYYSGYAMTTLNFGEDLSVVGGLRWEEVRSYFDAFNLSDGRDATTEVIDTVSAHPETAICSRWFRQNTT